MSFARGLARLWTLANELKQREARISELEGQISVCRTAPLETTRVNLLTGVLYDLVEAAQFYAQHFCCFFLFSVTIADGFVD
jgi:hypothetical protein